MKDIDLSYCGREGAVEVKRNPSYEELFKDETDPSLEGYEKAVLTELDALNVFTGAFFD